MNVFITGVSSGLGLELARIFLQEGHRVGGCSFEAQPEVAARLPEPIRYYQADVTDREALAAAIRDFAGNGQLDILIASAGISMPKQRIPDFERGRQVFKVNLLGLLNAFEPAIAIMKAQGHGHLVTMGSVSGFTGMPGMAIYGASKSAVINLCESFEIDLHRFGIHVTCVAPGFIDTPLTRQNPHKMPFLMSQEKAARLIRKAIARKKGLCVFPWQMYLISTVLYHLPRPVYKWFMKKDPLRLAGEA